MNLVIGMMMVKDCEYDVNLLMSIGW